MKLLITAMTLRLVHDQWKWSDFDQWLDFISCFIVYQDFSSISSFILLRKYEWTLLINRLVIFAFLIHLGLKNFPSNVGHNQSFLQVSLSISIVFDLFTFTLAPRWPSITYRMSSDRFLNCFHTWKSCSNIAMLKKTQSSLTKHSKSLSLDQHTYS